MAESLLKIKDIFQRRKDGYKSVDFKIAMIRKQDQWYNSRTRVLLSYAAIDEKSEKIIDTDDFVVLHYVTKAEKFPEFLEKIENMGYFTVNGANILYFDLQTRPYPAYWDNYSNNSEVAEEEWKIEWPLDVFCWESSHKLENELDGFLRKITPTLNCYDPPFETVFEAVRELVGLRKWDFQDSSNARGSRCYLLMPSFAAINKCILDGNDFRISVKFHESIDIQHLRLSLITRGKELLRNQLSFEGDPVASRPPIKEVNKHVTMDNVADVQAYLFLEGDRSPSDKRSVRNQRSTLNLRLMAHEVFDEESETLLEWLQGKGQEKSRNFEYAVTALLHLCGFQTEWIGHKGLTIDGPDIFAFSSKPQVLFVGECTVKIPDINKIRDLKERTEQLKQNLKIDVKPIIFTCLNRLETIEAEASISGASIISLTNLIKMFNMASRGRPTEEISGYLLSSGAWG